MSIDDLRTFTSDAFRFGRRVKRQRTSRRDNPRPSTGATPALTETDCQQIRQLRSQFLSKAEIARRFNVDPKVIARVINGTYHPRKDPQ